MPNEDRRAELARRIIENRQRLDMHNRLSSAEITDQKIATIKWLSKRVAEDEALLAKLNSACYSALEAGTAFGGWSCS